MALCSYLRRLWAALLGKDNAQPLISQEILMALADDILAIFPAVQAATAAKDQQITALTAQVADLQQQITAAEAAVTTVKNEITPPPAA